MANHKSSKIRIRRNARRAAINTSRRSRLRTFLKKIEVALEAKDAKQAQEAFKKARPEIQRGVAKGILTKGTASRKIARLSAKIKALSKGS